jgi:UDP-N-acetylmuramoyl-L-alanyl-D-glutamate--2,6-diaminopimelate ligase
VVEQKESIPPILRPDSVVPVPLESLADRFELPWVGASSDVLLTGISMNTADLRPGDLFVAMPGLKTHGANFAQKAKDAGAVAIVTDAAGAELLQGVELPTLLLEHPRAHLGELAAFVYGNLPGTMPKLFATTGTNGKTSTSYLLEAMLRQLGEVTGLTSTAERHIAGEVIVSRLTTPESTEMNALLARMKEKGVTSAVLEVSAQALTQLRVDGIHFDVAAFTNLSHDHLDDYGDMETYFKAKLGLFTDGRAERAVVSLDSPYGARVAELANIPVVTVSSHEGVQADYRVEILDEQPSHTEFKLIGPEGELVSRIPIIGAHMAANAGLAIVMLLQVGFEWKRIVDVLGAGVEAYLPGRTERVTRDSGPDVYVDFGHSPDAFLNTLAAVRKVTKGRVFMVFGADGDRDASKRPAMAQVAAEGCDVLVITDHHPRFEDPASIRKTLVDAARGARPELEIYEVSPPEAAIRKAVSLARPGDAILWAGPGHQDYRDIRGVRTVYSARQEARLALAENGWK